MYIYIYVCMYIYLPQDASIERVQGMVKEVVHVIGAMSARLTEQLGTSTDPQV
jgi:hypothetical protein